VFDRAVRFVASRRNTNVAFLLAGLAIGRPREACVAIVVWSVVTVAVHVLRVVWWSLRPAASRTPVRRSVQKRQPIQGRLRLAATRTATFRRRRCLREVRNDGAACAFRSHPRESWNRCCRGLSGACKSCTAPPDFGSRWTRTSWLPALTGSPQLLPRRIPCATRIHAWRIGAARPIRGDASGIPVAR